MAVLDALAAGPELAARPPFVYDVDGARSLVRAYYRARLRLPANTTALWGAGCYAMSRAGRSRFGHFPGLVADDYFVDTLFDPHEKRVVDVEPVVVRSPRTSRALGRVLRRTYGGNAELPPLRARRGPTGPRSPAATSGRCCAASAPRPDWVTRRSTPRSPSPGARRPVDVRPGTATSRVGHDRRAGAGGDHPQLCT